MNPLSKEEMSSFLEQVEEVSSAVNAIIKGDPSAEKEVLSKHEFKERLQKIKEEEREMELRKGRKGQGEKDNYASFCEKCSMEFQRATPNCVYCNGLTLTYAQRRQDLLQRVEELKQRRSARESRKKNWENFKKTSSMLPNSLTDYRKWEAFTDSEGSEDEKANQPILPTDNPQFQALEADITQRAKKAKADRAEALRLKEKGNEFLRQGKFGPAIEEYSKGLELDRGAMPLWLNRALARMKNQDFKMAVEDCERVIEYCEVLGGVTIPDENEDSNKAVGNSKNKEHMHKALLRRAAAYRELGEFGRGLEDLSRLRRLVGGEDSESTSLRIEIERLRDEREKVEKLKLEGKKLGEVEELLEKRDVDWKKLIELVQKGEEERIVLAKNEAIWTKIKELLGDKENQKAEIINKSEKQISKISPEEQPPCEESQKSDSKKSTLSTSAGLLDFLTRCAELSDSLLDSLISSGILHSVRRRLVVEASGVSSDCFTEQNFSDLAEICRVASLKQRGRRHLLENTEPFIETLTLLLTTKTDSSETKTISNLKVSTLSLFPLLANLFFQESENSQSASFKLRFVSLILEPHWSLLLSFFPSTKTEPFASFCLMLSNLSTNLSIAQRILPLLSSASSPSFPSFFAEKFPLSNETQASSFLALLVNISTQCPKEFPAILNPALVSTLCLSLILAKFSTEINSKLLVILARASIDPALLPPIAKALQPEIENLQGSRIAVEIIKFLNFQAPNFPLPLLKSTLSSSESSRRSITGYILSSLQTVLTSTENGPISRANNLCVFGSLCVERMPEFEVSFGELIPPLTKIIKDKLGTLRTSAAILLAKLCKNEKNLAIARENHSTEILVSLASVLLPKK